MQCDLRVTDLSLETVAVKRAIRFRLLYSCLLSVQPFILKEVNFRLQA